MIALAISLFAPAALADEKAAEECVHTKVWDAYADGWGVRTLTSTTLANSKTRNYLVTLYAGNDYRVIACGDSTSKNLDVLLYNTEGEVLARDKTEDRQPSFTFTPKKTATYYVVLYLRDVEENTDSSGVGMAVIYK